MYGAGSPEVEVRALQGALAALCGGLDPDDIPLPQAQRLWSSFAAIERLAAGARCRLARRVEESRTWLAEGDRCAASWMARRSATTTGRARAELEVSQRLAALAATDRALARGQLSSEQASAIAEAASVDPMAEERLLRTAERHSLGELRNACARVRAGAEDEAERHARLHRQRALRTWRGSDGSWNLQVRNTPAAGAEVEAAMAPLVERIFSQARLAGRREPAEAYGADGLTQMARLAVGADDVAPGRTSDGASPAVVIEGDGGVAAPRRRSRRPDTKVIVLIDHQALLRGRARAGETCEIAGVGPVPVATVRSLLGDAFGAAIVTDGVDVFTVAHLGRSVSAHQRTALEARGYRCEVPGCGSTTALEIDHITEWHRRRRTTLDQLCWLCRSHHHDKTHRGWRLRGAPGDRRWVPPGAPPGPNPPAAPTSDPVGRSPTLFGEPPAA